MKFELNTHRLNTNVFVFDGAGWILDFYCLKFEHAQHNLKWNKNMHINTRTFEDFDATYPQTQMFRFFVYEKRTPREGGIEPDTARFRILVL